MAATKQDTFNEFHKTAYRLLKLLLSLSEEQLNFQPTHGWSAGQLGDHLYKSYQFVEILNGKTTVTERPIDQKLDPINALFADDSIKMNAPKAVLPSNEKIDKNDLIKSLENRVKQIKETIEASDLSLTCIAFSIPAYGEFTRYEWIWFNIYHTQRHCRQLENIIVSNNLFTK
ncbi:MULTISPECIES: DinB family protein [Sphingobacterium]|uniref:DinB family protein n=1 Tax=Sphingobacterium TaxID=28453 RepID=UPI00257DBBB3|nr:MULTISPECIES: DinB family protein [Sphingobacterium]